MDHLGHITAAGKLHNACYDTKAINALQYPITESEPE